MQSPRGCDGAPGPDYAPTLAEQGVPAHTISTSKMDSEKFYHTTEDEIETLDMNNMAAIIKAIALSSLSIISGKDTPSRIPKEQE